jgi:putative solute:sodium symporter small subunit
MPADSSPAGGAALRLAPARLARHWRRTRVLTFALLGLWLCVVLGTGLFARDLQKLRFFGWPLSYYMGAQGALLVFLLIIGLYAWLMRRYDREAVGLPPPADPPPAGPPAARSAAGAEAPPGEAG